MRLDFPAGCLSDGIDQHIDLALELLLHLSQLSLAVFLGDRDSQHDDSFPDELSPGEEGSENGPDGAAYF